MQNAGYIVVFLANFYTSIRIFARGLPTGPDSLMNEFLIAAVTAFGAGTLAAIPKKADWKKVAVASVAGPALICGLMAPAILSSGSFHLFPWLMIPVGGAAISTLSFMAIKKLFRRY